ncbi:MAG: two-component regulator propeller domain-containing protein [Bacteroidota bacterium]
MKKVLVIILSLFNQILFAQLQRNYTTYNVDNGLAQNTVWDVTHDYKGFLWIGTADGLNRFDGYKMYHYRHETNDSNSIYGTTGFNFYEDSLKNLWVGHDRGLSIYNRVSNTFNNIFKNPNGISIMGIDDDGILWTVSAAKYIYGFDLKTFQLKHTVFANQYWHNSYGALIASVKIGSSFFIGFSRNIILQFKPQSLSFQLYSTPFPINSTIHSLNENTFCSFMGNKATIFTVINDSAIISVKKYTNADTANFRFSGSVIYNNKLYVGGLAGLFVFDAKTLNYEEHISSFSYKQNDAYPYVQTVKKDNNGNLYICSNGGGLHIYSPYKNKFKHYTNNSPKKSLFKSITTTNDGRIFAGCYAEGFTAFEPNGYYKTFKPEVMGPNATIHGLYKLSENELLLTHYNSIYKYNIKTKVYKSIPFDKEFYSISYPYFQKIGNQLWLNINNNDDAGIFDLFTGKKILSIKNNNITSYLKLNQNNILLGTTKGLLLYNLNTKKTTRTKVQDFVKSILITTNNKIYVSTIVGLYVVKVNGEIETHYSSNNGLKNNFIYGALEDNNGKIWFSHNRGISVFNPENAAFKHYGVNDGLQSNEFNTGAYYKDEKGLLYFGGVNGINVVDPTILTENKKVPKIAINEILLGDMPYKSDTAYNEINTLKLSYLENTLSFDFSALEFSQPEDNTYQYKMEGIDEKWIESGTRHFARYANLPPGNYIFKILASNGDGHRNPQARELFINIIPPFWQRTWFYILLFLLSIVGIGSIIMFYINRQKIKLKRELEVQQKLEQERSRISRDLHDNVGAQLSYLITNVEWMLQHPDRINKEEEQLRLQSLSEAGRNAILTLRQTIWAISHKELTVEDFADRFKQFALKMIEFNNGIQVHFQEHFMHTKTLSPAVALNIFRICQEAFNNCLKHAQCTVINIRFDSNNDFVFTFTINDDGIGFDWDEANQKGHYGLINMQARAKETEAELIIKAEKGKGTTLILQLK